jgi:hypothetical protein
MVVIVEDAFLHPALPLLAWMLMAASGTGTGPKYSLGPVHAAAYLTIVRDAARARAQEEFPAQPGPPLTATPAALAHLGSARAALVRALVVRSLYGGLAGDVLLLRNAAAVWAARFENDIDAAASSASGGSAGGAGGGGHGVMRRDAPARGKSWLSFIEDIAAGGDGGGEGSASGGGLPRLCGPFPTQLAALPRLTIADIPLSAVDHHCSDIVGDVLARAAAPSASAALQAAVRAAREALGDSLRRRLESALWTLRSAVNAREKIGGGGGGAAAAAAASEEEGEDEASVALAHFHFRVLEPHFDSYSRSLLATRFD